MMTAPRRRVVSALLAAPLFILAACGVSTADDFPPRVGETLTGPIPGSDNGSVDADPQQVREGLEQDAWWSPALFVDCTATTNAGCAGDAVEGVYNAIPAGLTTRPWQLCAAVPHLNDPYWVAVNYGMVEEARRLGVNLDFFEAGGYTELSKQLSQIDDCVAMGADAVIIGAISFEGLDARVEQLKQDGVVVIDALNGIASDEVNGRAVLSWRELGSVVGRYLAAREGGENVAWLPGPPGAGWAEDSNVGFTEAVAGSRVAVAETKYGETDKNVQLRLVEDALQANTDVTVVAGTAVTVDAAAAAGLDDRVELIGTYMSPESLAAIREGAITCSASDQPAVQARMAVDMAVRLLEGLPLDEGMERASPAPVLVCGPRAGDAENVDDFVSETTFAPLGWQPVFTVSAE